MYSQSTPNSEVVKYENFLGGAAEIDQSIMFNSKTELLCMILDLTPTWWLKYPETVLSNYIDTIVAFSSIYLSLSERKELAIIGVVPGRSEYIYTTDMKPDSGPVNSASSFMYTQSQSSGFSFPSPYSISLSRNRFLQFADKKIRENTLRMITDCQSIDAHVNLSGGFIKALCYFRRMLKTHQSQNNQSDFNGRFIVVRTTLPDGSASFMSMMNAVFTAQKLAICIDVCILNPDDSATTGAGTGVMAGSMINPTSNDRSVVGGGGSTVVLGGGGGGVGNVGSTGVGTSVTANTVINSSNNKGNSQFDKANILRQSVDMTNGIYLTINKMRDLLQYFITLYLPDVEDRKFLTMINKSNVEIDFRASCFCHGNLVSVGYVCSLCLAVFCQYSSLCACCWAIFNDQRLTKVVEES